MKGFLMNAIAAQNHPPATLIGGSRVKLIVGIFFAVVGVLLTLDNFDLADADRFLVYWPVVFIAIGILKFQDRQSRLPAGVAIVAGTLLLFLNTGWLSVSFFDLWPLALVIVGAGIVAHAFGIQVPTLSGQSGSTVWAILGVRKIAIDSRSYTGGRIFAFMGGCVLDLTKADMENGPATIDVLVTWGGIEIKVPDGWEVIGNLMPIMGGAEIRTKAAAGGRKLIVNGLAIMGGVDIKSVAAEAV
jgi:predicted membrane protein